MNRSLREGMAPALVPLRGRRSRVVLGVVAAVALLLESVFAAGAGSRLAAITSDLALPTSGLLAAAACGFSARARRGRPRLAWALMSGSMLLVTIGASVHSFRNLFAGEVGGTAAAGPFYLVAILLALAAVALLPFLPRGGLRGMVRFLDGVVLTCGLFIVAWSFVLGPLYNAATGPPAERLLPVLYLGGTVAVLAVVVFQLSVVKGDVRAPAVMVVAMLAMVAANGAYLYQQLSGSYVTGSWVDGGWPACYLLVGTAALLADPREERSAGRRVAFQSAIPYITSIIAALVGGVDVALAGGRVDPPLLVLAVGIGVFLCLRLLVGQRDQRLLVSDLADAKQRLEEVLDAAPILLFTLDAEGRAILTRGPLAAAIELEGEPVPGRADLPLELREAVGDALDGRARRLRVEVGELELEFRLRPANSDAGDPVRVIGVAVDTSEQRRAEEAERENAAKTRFMAQMSHELRTPLNSVLGFTQMLQMEQDPLTERQLRWLANVRSSADHLLALINDLLDLGQGPSGQLEIEVAPVEVGPVVAHAIAKMSALAEKRGVSLTAPKVDGVALADQRRLGQVLLNLLSNAVKFTPAGGEVWVETEPAGDHLRLTVADTGIGIRPPDRARIFEDFTQLSDGRTRSEEGSGLGLALSRRLCALMGAAIEVDSELGRGSRFTVVLRATTQESPRPDGPVVAAAR